MKKTMSEQLFEYDISTGVFTCNILVTDDKGERDEEFNEKYGFLTNKTKDENSENLLVKRMTTSISSLEPLLIHENSTKMSWGEEQGISIINTDSGMNMFLFVSFSEFNEFYKNYKSKINGSI